MEEALWNYTLLSDLPYELLELILSCDEISFEDVCRFSETCSFFREVGNSNKVWRIKYQKKWPELFLLIEGSNTDWNKEFQTRYHYGKLVNDELTEMSEELYLYDNASNDAFLKFQALLGKHVIAYKMLIDELERIIHDGKNSENLTQKYYAKRVLRYVRHLHLQEVWKDYLSDPVDNQCLEVGACLLAQWCQPTQVCCTKTVMRDIDDLSNRVKEKVKEVCPKHPVLQIELVQEVLTESLWTQSHCRIILLCINNLLFQVLKFTGSRHDYYCADSTFIDQVIGRRMGIPISLGVLYSAIARRLGVCCLSVNFPGHFLLKWLEHPHLDHQEAYTYIDVYNKGTFRKRIDCYQLIPGYQTPSDSWFESVSPVKVLIRMCWNLVEVGRQLEGVGEGLHCLCNALELLSILNPGDAEHKLLLARVYLHLCINMKEVISLIREVSAHDPAMTGVVSYMYQSALNQLESQRARSLIHPKIIPKTREDESSVKFAVGMIMKHMKYNYRCVIYAWDGSCNASKDWIKQMGVCNLAYQDKQPFYHVLANDGSNRYAAQENLEIDLECRPISHPDVGRYFEAYRGTYYLPNAQKSSEYPDDASVRDSLFSFGEFFMYKDKSPFPGSILNPSVE